MFCVKCGNEVENDAKFCPVCGAPSGSEENNASTGGEQGVIMSPPNPMVNMMPGLQPPVQQKKKKTGIIVAAVIVGIIFVGCVASLGNSSGSSSGSSNRDSSVASSSTPKKSIYELMAPEEGEDFSYRVSEKAKIFLSEHENLFPVRNIDDINNDLIDFSIDMRQISKNQENYGDKLMNIDLAYVMSIAETNMSDGSTFTEMQVCDANQYNYYLLYEGQIDGVYQDSVVHIIGLPLGNTAFSNIGGGTTLAVIVAGSYVELVE